MRAGAGENVRSMKDSPPLEQVKTSALQALRKYTQGARAMDNAGDYPRAISLLEVAIREDTLFAMAYRVLGIALGNQGGQEGRAMSMKARAFALRQRLADKERYLTEATYYTATED